MVNSSPLVTPLTIVTNPIRKLTFMRTNPARSANASVRGTPGRSERNVITARMATAGTQSEMMNAIVPATAASNGDSKKLKCERVPRHCWRLIKAPTTNPAGHKDHDHWHHEEWLEACLGGPKPGSNFDYSGPLSEVVLLGNLALRTGRRIEWDAANMKCTNVPEANQFVKREYRKGWELA